MKQKDRFFEEHRKEVTVKGACKNRLTNDINSVFQDFEIYFRTEDDLDEDDITLVVNEYL